MSITRAWSHCPLCPDEVWKPSEEFVRLPKPVKINGQIHYWLCRDHAKKLVLTLKKRRVKRGK